MYTNWKRVFKISSLVENVSRVPTQPLFGPHQFRRKRSVIQEALPAHQAEGQDVLGEREQDATLILTLLVDALQPSDQVFIQWCVPGEGSMVEAAADQTAQTLREHVLRLS